MDVAAKQSRWSTIEVGLVLAFVGLNALDAALTVMLVNRGFLCMEVSPHMKSLFILWGPPHYSFSVFWATKMSLAVACVPIFFLLARAVPRLRSLVLVLPVLAMVVVCISNATGLIE